MKNILGQTHQQKSLSYLPLFIRNWVHSLFSDRILVSTRVLLQSCGSQLPLYTSTKLQSDLLCKVTGKHSTVKVVLPLWCPNMHAREKGKHACWPGKTWWTPNPNFLKYRWQRSLDAEKRPCLIHVRGDEDWLQVDSFLWSSNRQLCRTKRIQNRNLNTGQDILLRQVRSNFGQSMQIWTRIFIKQVRHCFPALFPPASVLTDHWLFGSGVGVRVFIEFWHPASWNDCMFGRKNTPNVTLPILLNRKLKVAYLWKFSTSSNVSGSRRLRVSGRTQVTNPTRIEEAPYTT